MGKHPALNGQYREHVFGPAPAHQPRPHRDHSVPPTFVAIDFETADHGRDSAISVAAVRVERGVVTESYASLIRPLRAGVLPRFQAIHGLSYRHVERAPIFPRVHARLAEMWQGADYLVAHNASFDRSVLAATAGVHNLAAPIQPWVCTVKAARALRPGAQARLSAVAEDLGIPLLHHDAHSDARACADVALRFLKREPRLFERFAIAAPAPKAPRFRARFSS